MIKKGYMKKGFALILVLLFTAISLMVVSTVALALVSGAKLNRQSKIISKAYILAKGGIDAGYIELVKSDKESPSWPDISACTTNKKYNIYYFDGGEYVYYPSDELGINLAAISLWITPDRRNDGFFAARLCFDDDIIKAIGYIDGQKLTLQAYIEPKSPQPVLYHYSIPQPDICPVPPAVGPCVPQPPIDGMCIKNGYSLAPGTPDCDTVAGFNMSYVDPDQTKYDHTQDKIKIFQSNS